MSEEQEDKAEEQSAFQNVQSLLLNKSNGIYYLNGYKEDLKKSDLERLVTWLRVLYITIESTRMSSQSSWMECIKNLPISTTILVVENQATVRECLRELLAAGSQVSEAVDAAEALECMTADGAPDVLVVDMHLGLGMSGLDLIAAARLRWPGVRAVLISGTSMEEPVLGPGDRFLRKPFTAEALCHAVWELATRRDELHVS